MKIKILILGILILVLHSCEKDNLEDTPQKNSINKIMSLGASRVAGNRPEYESYRYELWKKLSDNNWDFDFVGTMSDNANYPSHNNKKFDTDHEGRGGWITSLIINGLNGWLAQTGSPDIVLFSSPGGNDLLGNLDYDQTLSNINTIIDILQKNNPNVTIIIEQLAQGSSRIMTPERVAQFNKVHIDISALTTEQTTDASKVIAVDMNTGFTDNMLADDIHYNEVGAKFIADRYYDILVNVLKK